MSVEKLYPAASWYVIRTVARQEERAIKNLTAWRVETFLPKLRVRRLNPFTGATMYAAAAMFPQYAFARFDASKLLHQVCYTRGVRSVVRIGGVPARVDDSIIELIQSQIEADGFVQIKDDLKVGDRVKIMDGALNNFIGVFDYRIDNTERVAILLTSVSYQPRIVIEREFLEKIDSNIAA